MHIAIKPDLAEKTVDGELFILNRADSEIHFLNETAAFLWRNLRENRTRERLAGRLSAEFDVSEQQALSDVDDFLRSVVDKKLVSIG